MKRFLISALLVPLVISAAGPTPAKAPAAAAVANKAEAVKKPEEKKIEETSMIEDLKLLYKNTEAARTKIKNHAIAQYNTITNSDYFQIGKCTVAGLFLYYGAKQFHSFTLPETNAALGGLSVGTGNPFAEGRPQVIYHFLTSRENFGNWLKNPITKASIKILLGSLMLKKQTMETVSLYNKAVKRYL